MRIDVNSWYYAPDHEQLCQVIEAQTLWGKITCRVWLPDRDSVVRVPAARLQPGHAREAQLYRVPHDLDAAPCGFKHERHPYYAGT